MNNAFLGLHITIIKMHHISDATLILSWEIACPESLMFRTHRAHEQTDAGLQRCYAASLLIERGLWVGFLRNCMAKDAGYLPAAWRSGSGNIPKDVKNQRFWTLRDSDVISNYGN
jgi:hypothetical protein